MENRASERAEKRKPRLFFVVDIEVKSGSAGLLFLWNWDYSNPDWYRQQRLQLMGGMWQNHCRKPQVLQEEPGTSFIQNQIWSGETKRVSKPQFLKTSETKKSIITPHNQAESCCYFRISSKIPALLYIYLLGDSQSPLFEIPEIL